MVHGMPGKSRKLRSGDIVSIDCGTVYEGFVGDSAFSTAVGDVSPEASKLMDITEQALYAGIDKMRPGQRTGDVSAAIQKVVELMATTSPAFIPDMALGGVCTKVLRSRIMGSPDAAFRCALV